MTAAELSQHQREEDMKAVLSTPEGRRFFWHLLDDVTRLHAASFTGDALTTAYAEGRRSVGIELMTEAQRVALPGYRAMVAEALQELAQPKPEEPEQ
jgi:hypothetical protein